MGMCRKSVIWILGVLMGIVAVFAVLRATPFPALERYVRGPRTVELFDRGNQRIGFLHGEEGTRRYTVALEDIPEEVIETLLAAEDRRFFFHPGVDPLAVARSVHQNIRAGKVVSGASTVTMQLARIVSPHGGGFRGKLMETWNAVRLETRYSKSELLELYVNGLPFGSNVEGIESASRLFFGVPVSRLEEEEALLLSVIPRRPQYYHPHRNPEQLVAAALVTAEAAGIETDREQLTGALDRGRERAEAYRRLESRTQRIAPHFRLEVAEALPAETRSSGGRVQTTLDLGMQRELEQELRAAFQLAEFSRIRNGGAVAVDHRRGEVRAYVGSVDYYDTEHGGMINTVRTRRHSGSTLKPFLYALALKEDYTASTILPDLPQVFGGEEAYMPRNFSGRYAGPVRLRTALASSLNVPAVYTAMQLGVSEFSDLLSDLGFSDVDSQRHVVGPGIAVGNMEIRLLDLVRAFTVFPNDGELIPFAVLTDEETEGSAPTEGSEQTEGSARTEGPERVFSRATAQIIRDILSDKAERALGFGRRSALDTDFPTIAKTGTGDQFSDIWAVASDPDLTVGVWMGNVDGSTVIGSPGSSFPARAAIGFLSSFHDPESSFPPLDDVHTVQISPVSGMKYDPPQGGSIRELFPKGEYPPRDTWHTAPGGPVRYPVEYQAWAKARGLGVSEGEDGSGIADDSAGRESLGGVDGSGGGEGGYAAAGAGGSDESRASGTVLEPAAPEPGDLEQTDLEPASSVTITRPNDGAQFYRSPRLDEGEQRVPAEVISDGEEPIQLFWNGSLIAEGRPPLHVRVPLTRGTHELVAVAGPVRDTVSFRVGSDRSVR